ncbi:MULTISPECIES: Na(+)-translocating NADH-quinone reductase subunit C [Flavobacteriaceae]|jgi:Na+-transporting NADH:ubiquinone oxidoreductase subunit C|uniref:Na(+)-translocating NADH-quinone reductase subunit C n=1 Tax=Flagellimonas sp. MMG031 TaxID=3158549 RepID=A0AAU7N206_9FLAO|nr:MULTISPECIES: Na(+)-translocating NADH-quinone reductase subunit C [unclassified Allomuricauda]MBO6531564.1 Na(+)-translocating NADH-quinone reductase subunit C [Allomuricauda sp.]MBO6589455.1 Na(+)-translocating NADH-quinone reductase subunit C [Allomuricauda sp.]MBO6619113.1 Na(+)-translocating NADH-quinone reductase subunit C [Allomuricauda sp.]MBO6644991.1 Na(+)-translocating NADH-quinone reductase subunit C [Allomuricauda sp.]MBO6747234.1 Na(+)-translocating NADH-quinone reductase subu
MAVNTEKNGYTVIFAVLMVVVVGSLLAFVASGLKPMIDENVRFEKQQNILYAMGVNENEGDGDVSFVPTSEVEGAFSKYITQQLVWDGSQVVERDNAYLINVEKALAEAKSGGNAELPLLVGEKDGEKYYIIPMYGKGLWDAIWGYMSVGENMEIKGVFFDHKGETPGLGSNINQRFFMDDFKGESVMDGDTYEGVQVAKGNNDPLNENKEDNEVDALAGATITGNGVSAMIKESLKLYKPYLQTIRSN